MGAKLLTELVGTFFLVLTIGLTASLGGEVAPIAIGAVLVALVYMGGPVSGAHYNPAVTVALWMRGRLPASEIAPYVGVQVAGAALAALAVYAVNGRPLTVAPAAETGPFAFFLLELLFTFALVLVILNVATSRRTEGNDAYGLAIGLVVMGGAFAAGPVSGGAFNPAVALGPALVGAALGEGAAWAGLWVYLVAPASGGALAVFAFRVQNPGDV